MRKGDLALFNASIQRYTEYYIKKGVYFLLDRVKTILYRNVLRKVVRGLPIINGQDTPGNVHVQGIIEEFVALL